MVSAYRFLRLSGGVAHLVERQLCKLDVAGSSPVTSTIFLEIAAVKVS